MKKRILSILLIMVLLLSLLTACGGGKKYPYSGDKLDKTGAKIIAEMAVKDNESKNSDGTDIKIYKCTAIIDNEDGTWTVKGNFYKFYYAGVNAKTDGRAADKSYNIIIEDKGNEKAVIKEYNVTTIQSDIKP